MRARRRITAVALASAAAGAGICAVLAAALERRPGADFYATRPPFERPLPFQRIPRGLRSLSARECGTCHVEIYREWQQSVHAQAWVDPQFQAEFRKQPGVAWMCVNCHTPLVNQLDSLVVALRDGDVERPVRRANPDFDAPLRREAITCATCHVRDGVVRGPFRGVRAPHASGYGPEFRSPGLCLRCHQAVQAYPGKNFVCTFQTGDEWRAGPAAARSQICQDCHMPEIHRPLVAGGPSRRGGLHGWIGSHLRKGNETDVARWDSMAARRPAGVELRAGTLEEIARPGPDATTWSWRPVALNAHAGHWLPTGDPEREVVVEVAALGPRGDTLARAERVIAQKYQWSPVVRKLRDDRLAAGDSVVIPLAFVTRERSFRLVARAVNVRISDANAAYHRLPAWYPRRTEVARLELPAGWGSAR